MTIATNGDFISTCAGVGGGWRRIVNININAGDDWQGKPATSIDEYYISGLSITHGNNPRQHIWSFVSGHTERCRHYGNCPCASFAVTTPPSVVANNYYCESHYILLIIIHISSMTHYGTEQDA